MKNTITKQNMTQIRKRISATWDYVEFDNFGNGHMRYHSEYNMLELKLVNDSVRIQLYTWSQYVFESNEIDADEYVGQCVFDKVFSSMLSAIEAVQTLRQKA